MEGASLRVILLSIGLCFMFHHVNTVNVRLYGTSPFNQQDMSGTLAELRSKEANLEARIRSTSHIERWFHEMELQGVRASIEFLEATSRVPYRDYLQSLSEERRQLESEMAELRKKLVEAENARLQAVDALESQKRNKGAELAPYENRLKTLTDQRNNIANQFAEFTERCYRREEKMRQERNQFHTEKGEMEQALDAAKKKHAQAFNAVSATSTEGFKPVSISEQEEMIELRNDLTLYNGMKDRKQLKEGLETTKLKLEKLLEKLYQAGKFSPKISREDLMSGFSEMEKNIILKREEIEKEKANRVDKLKKKDVASIDDEEIASIQKTSEEIKAMDFFHREIARRGIFLRGIFEVSDLLKECSNAIRDANERNLANLWADAIQEAADSPLGQLWAQSLQDAKDSELAKAWAEAIQDAKNSEVAQAFTNAIEQAKDINLAQVWTDVVTNLQNSPLAKMWSDAIQNATDSTFTKYCADAVEGAKMTLCRIVSFK